MLRDMVHVEDLPGRYIRFLQQLQALADHENRALSLSEKFGVKIRTGERNSVLLGPPSTIILEPWALNNPEVILHELRHLVQKWSGVEGELINAYGDADEGIRLIESFCEYAEGFMKIPEPMMKKATDRFGHTARAVHYMQQLSFTTINTAMFRWVHAYPSAERAGFIFKGNAIQDVAICNSSLPFWIGERVPEPQILIPQGSYFKLPSGYVLGIVEGSP
jgi:hypothetical protein